MTKINVNQIRRGITPKLRKFILENGAFCVYCGFPASEVDHIIPVSRGGGVVLSNLAPACFECNREKRDNTVDEWEKNRRLQGRPWPIPHFFDRIAAYIERHNIDPEDVGSDSCQWIKSLPDGYTGLRNEIVAARNQVMQ